MRKSKVLKFYFSTLRWAALRRLLGRGRIIRSEAFVRDVYERAYREAGNEALERIVWRNQTVRYRGELTVMPVIAYKAFLVRKFSALITRYQVRSLLELGSGRGLLTVALAALHPELDKVAGIELTASGVMRARELLCRPALPVLCALTGLDEAGVVEGLRGRSISFIQGSMSALPYADQSFDAVFSNSAIEQIPRGYPRVFKETRRVARRAFFSEPFREAQRNFFQRLTLANLDYFRVSWRVLEQFGWKPSSLEVPELQKIDFNTGFVVCEARREPGVS